MVIRLPSSACIVKYEEVEIRVFSAIVFGIKITNEPVEFPLHGLVMILLTSVVTENKDYK